MTVSFKQIKGVVLDIEGTTCPVDFVSGQLFPYARRALPAYLAEHGQDPELAPLLAEVRQAMVTESDGTAPQELVAYLQWLIDQDRKFTPLKDLQGRLWRQGYGAAIGMIGAVAMMIVMAFLLRIFRPRG